MSVKPAPHLEPLLPILGEHSTSGSVHDETGAATAEISGSDAYSLLPGGHWIAHDVDVAIGDQPTVVHELIGGSHAEGGWQMHAFDAAENPGLMRLTQEESGLFLLHGDGIRSWFRPQPGEDHMTTLWEREVDGTWLRWMDMRFDRR